MASPFFPSSSSPLPLPPRSPIFVPIPEHEKEEEPSSTVTSSYVHKPTPLHRSTIAASANAMAGRRRPSKPPKTQADGEAVSVSCSTCRPTSRDKLVYVVPFDGGGVGGRHQHTPGGGAPSSSPSRAGGLLRSLFVSLTGRSPAVESTSSSSAAAAVRDDQWRLVAAELSRKLLNATRKRDEALHEASRLKYSIAELERKINRLESHCRDLQSSLQPGPEALSPAAPGSGVFPTQAFHLAVVDARAAVRYLARSLVTQLRQGPPGARSSDRVATLIQPYDPRAAVQWRRNPAGLLSYMEALLNQAFYAGFDEDEEEEAALVDPAARCAASKAGYEAVRDLGWDEVLSKGTRHYSEGLSRFCDRKMSEVVTMVGWARAWPEGLLQAFFGAAKGAWVVRLMARSVHPALPVLRASQGTSFDGRYMEDAAADRARRLTPASVRMLVAPGFHVYTDGGGVIKCKVLCVYDNITSNADNACSNNAISSHTISHERPLQQQKGEEI